MIQRPSSLGVDEERVPGGADEGAVVAEVAFGVAEGVVPVGGELGRGGVELGALGAGEAALCPAPLELYPLRVRVTGRQAPHVLHQHRHPGQTQLRTRRRRRSTSQLTGLLSLELNPKRVASARLS